MKAKMHNAIKPPMHNQMQKLQTLNSINKGIWNARGQGLVLRNVGNTSVKRKYFSTHDNIVKITKWNIQLLMDSMDHMQECTHESNLVIEKKLSKIQEGIVDKKLEYFKCKDKITNEIQMNIVNAITSLTNVIRKILKGDKGKDLLFPK